MWVITTDKLSSQECYSLWHIFSCSSLNNLLRFEPPVIGGTTVPCLRAVDGPDLWSLKGHPHLHGEAALTLPLLVLHARGQLPGLIPAICGGEHAWFRSTALSGMPERDRRRFLPPTPRSVDSPGHPPPRP